MSNGELVRCRVAACRKLGRWNFYLINDSDAPLDWAVLHTIGYEWGDWGNAEKVDVRVTDLAPGAYAHIWRDDGSGAELRMDLSLRVCVRGREVPLHFEFPKLYLQHNLPMVEELGKPGLVVAAEAPIGGR